MNTPFFISWRYQHSKHKNRLVSLIAFFSSMGIALGVVVLIVGLSAMNGFERELNQRILAVVPHAEIISAPGQGDAPIDHWQNLAVKLKQNSQIRGISPFVSFTALVENGAKLKVVQIKGVETTLQDQVSSLGRFVLNAGWQNFAQNGGLVLGSGIARDLDVQEGDWVSLLISQQKG
ncbi:ABC transporter permease, partial [Aggregatibacter actinomycetemcomitans]